jgi:hypothetical protein
MTQGKDFEDEVSTRGPDRPDHRDRLDRVAHGP